MQKACDLTKGTMAAVLGLENEIVEETVQSIDGVVVAANYNCPGQLVISGAVDAIHLACDATKRKRSATSACTSRWRCFSFSFNGACKRAISSGYRKHNVSLHLVVLFTKM